MSVAAKIAAKYVEAHGAYREKDGGSRGGLGVGDSRTTVGNRGVGSSGSEKKTVCFYCRKVGHGHLDFREWKADGKTISESGCDNDQAV